MQAKQNKAKDSFTASHGQAGVQPSPGEQESITSNSDWEDKCY